MPELEVDYNPDGSCMMKLIPSDGDLRLQYGTAFEVFQSGYWSPVYPCSIPAFNELTSTLECEITNLRMELDVFKRDIKTLRRNKYLEEKYEELEEAYDRVKELESQFTTFDVLAVSGQEE